MLFVEKATKELILNVSEFTYMNILWCFSRVTTVPIMTLQCTFVVYDYDVYEVYY